MQQAPDQLQSHMLADLLVYWERIRGDAAMPDRNALDPVDIPQSLPNLILFEREAPADQAPPNQAPANQAPADRLRAVVVGTRVVEFYGMDYTARYLDEIEFGSRRAAVLADYRAAIEAAAPIGFDHDFWNIRGAVYSIERLILPFTRDGSTVSHLLAGLDFKVIDPNPP